MKRIYIVTPTLPLSINLVDERPRLVRATTPAQAVRHVTKNLYGVAVASTEQAVNLTINGTKVEDATEE